MKTKSVVKIFIATLICTLAIFISNLFVSAADESIFVKSGLCYFGSTSFGEDASTMATIHFHSEVSTVYAMLTTEDDEDFSEARKVDLENVLIDYSAPLAKDPTKPLEQDKNFPAVSYECTGRLTDLTPNTKYMWYATDGTEKGNTFHFKTAAGDNSAFTFSYTTDPQTYTGGARWDRYDDWSDNIYTTAENNKLSVDFILSGGDDSENSGRAEHWSYFFRPDCFRKSAYMSAPGNHDFTGLVSSGSTDGRFFASMFGFPLNGPADVYQEIAYYFMYNDTLFVILSSSCASRSSQMTWLDDVMKNNPAQYKVICVHYPTNTDATDTFKEFIPTFQKYNVDFVLFGHTHTYDVQKNYYDRRPNTNDYVGTTYISASSPEGDSGSIVATQLFFTFTDTYCSFKSFTPDNVQLDSIPFKARRIPTSQTNNYVEEEFIKTIKANINQDSLKEGTIDFGIEAYNNVYQISLKTKDGKLLGSRYVTDSVNTFINVSGLTPQTNYDCVITLEYYDGTTKDIDYSFNTNISSYGTLEGLKAGMSAYGYRFVYSPNFRPEVKSLAVYVDSTKVQDAKITDKKITVDLALFQENKKYEIVIKGVLEDGTEVDIYSTTYGEDVKTYDVTFLGKDGAELSKAKVEEGKDAVAPEAPVVEGYTFKSWDKEFTKVNGDLVVNAVYEINKYTVKFLDKDGKELKSAEVEFGKDAEAPEAPVVEGYTFKSWDKEFTQVKADLEVKALYEVNKYMVKFLDKDGKELSTVEVEYGKAAEAPEAPVVEGFLFKSWDKEFTQVKADLEVKALYEVVIKKYTVKFLDKDGKELKSVEVEEGKAAEAPTAPTVEGFTFKSWDTEFTQVKADLVVKAVYEQNKVEEKEEKSGCNSASIIFTSLMLLGLCFIRRKRW